MNILCHFFQCLSLAVRRLGGWMIDGWMDGWMVVWMDRWMDGWTDEWMDGWVDRQVNGEPA